MIRGMNLSAHPQPRSQRPRLRESEPEGYGI